ncbi:carbohydrate phosphatase [Sordaria brevicollis]|uniref:Carbohydrate phosphatase n=1 Tax=Sordaria brevicollis TaxID=83679 RepID=A0AAE0NVP1_SORBR|nr:carbohydrate phosphatase [Sordaria brevicollis]
MGVLGAQHLRHLKSHRSQPHSHPIITPRYLVDTTFNTLNNTSPRYRPGFVAATKTKSPPTADDHHHLDDIDTPHLQHTLFQRQLLPYHPVPLRHLTHLNSTQPTPPKSRNKKAKRKMTADTSNPPYSHERHIAEVAVQVASLLTRRVLAGILKPSTSSTSSSGTSTPSSNLISHESTEQPDRRVSVASISKPDFSPVTAADFAVQALLTAAIRSHFPHDGFIGEEDADALRADPALAKQVFELIQSCATSSSPGEVDGISLSLPRSIPEMLSFIDLGGRGQGSPTARFWAMDPIDGTAAFMRGQQYAVSLCLIEGGKEVVGVLGCPNLAITLPFSSPSSSPSAPEKPNHCTQTYIISEDSTPSLSPSNAEEGTTTENGILLSAVLSQGATIRPIAPQSQSSSPSLLLPAQPLTKPTPTSSPTQVATDKLHFVDSLTTPATSSSLVARVATLAGVPNYSFPGTELYSSHMRYVAMILGGQSHVQVRIPKPMTKATYIWDHAGAQLIYVEATSGRGKVTDLWGRKIDYGRGRKLDGNWGVVTADEGVHGRLLEIVGGLVGNGI